ncbi:hypothetical protein ACYJW8_07945 [Frateuria aurantia]
MLPALGTVLYLPALQLRAWPIARPQVSVVAESPLLLPLLHTRTLRVASQVATSGPLEWMDCEDGVGQRLARIYLLPDSDYLAWDRITAHGEAEERPLATALRRWRPGAAILTGFRLRQLARVPLLSCAGYERLSGISLRVAGDLACRERVHLGAVSAPSLPAHSAVTSD